MIRLRVATHALTAAPSKQWVKWIYEVIALNKDSYVSNVFKTQSFIDYISFILNVTVNRTGLLYKGILINNNSWRALNKIETRFIEGHKPSVVSLIEDY